MIQDFMKILTSKAKATPRKKIPRATKHKKSLSLTIVPPLPDNGSQHTPVEFLHNLIKYRSIFGKQRAMIEAILQKSYIPVKIRCLYKFIENEA